MPEPTTPPTLVDEWELHSDLAKIAQQWKPLEETLQTPGSFQELSPGVSLWSSGMHAGHLALGSSFMAEMVRQCLADSAPNPNPEWADFTEAIFRKGGFRRGAAPAPEEMLPESYTPEYLLARLRESRRSWEDLSRQADLIQQCRSTRKHFAFGDLKAADWTRLCALHGAHHLRIIEDIREALQHGS